MNRREFRIGPGAASLLLIAVVVCMGVLGALSLVSARGDANLSRRSLEMAEATNGLNEAAERRLAELDALLAESAEGAEDDEAYLAGVDERLPEDMYLEDRVVTWEESSGDGRMLECGVEIAPLGAFPRANWTIHRHWTELEEEFSWD